MSNITYVCVYVLFVLCCYDNLSKKWPKMATAVHLSTNSSETIVVSNLNKAYSSEVYEVYNILFFSLVPRPRPGARSGDETIPFSMQCGIT